MINSVQQSNYGRNPIAFRGKETMIRRIIIKANNEIPKIKPNSDNSVYLAGVIIPHVLIGAVTGIFKIASAIIKTPFKGLKNLPKEAKELREYIQVSSQSANAILKAQGHTIRAKIFTEVDLLSPFKKLAEKFVKSKI